MTVEQIKKLGKEKSIQNLLILIELYKKNSLPVENRREIVSSIGRQNDNNIIYDFIKKYIFQENYMEVVYQMYRTSLYKSSEKRFAELSDDILSKYDNEILYKMNKYYVYKQNTRLCGEQNKHREQKNKITTPLLLCGDNKETLKKIPDQDVNLIFTSPPYYNAKEYSNYSSYKGYLSEMKKTLIECNRVLEDGRFIIINISPVITKRPGREFESIRYPIHFDFHKILEESGFYFIDEIIWVKPEPSVPNRIGGFLQTRKPLTYKPNCITESLLVYRKDASFLLDENIKKYTDKKMPIDYEIDKSNCWHIAPKSDKNHPAVFPEKLCERVLNYYSFENDVVLDPFAGSGTFGRVAIQMDRVPILCEQNENYIEQILSEQDENYIEQIIKGVRYDVWREIYSSDSRKISAR